MGQKCETPPSQEQNKRFVLKGKDHNRRVNEIVDRLMKLSEQDHAIIQPRSAKPITISVGELLGYDKRNVERQRLYGELQRLASEPEDSL